MEPNILNQFARLDASGKKLRVAVIGDLMTDIYYRVRPEKMCQEAPIPVYSCTTATVVKVPGGAGNACRQLRHLNVERHLFGVPILKQTKRRFVDYDDGRLMFRADVRENLPDYETARVQAEYVRAVVMAQKWDAIILSDYGKGTLANGVETGQYDGRLNLKLHDIRSAPVVVVDTRLTGAEKWTGSTVVKSNTQEAGCLSPKDVANACIAKASLQTHAGGFWSTAGDYCHPAGPIKNPVSVVGAGDCFTAFLAVGLARGLNLIEAGEVAYAAGREYVQHAFNQPVDPRKVTTP